MLYFYRKFLAYLRYRYSDCNFRKGYYSVHFEFVQEVARSTSRAGSLTLSPLSIHTRDILFHCKPKRQLEVFAPECSHSQNITVMAIGITSTL